MASRSGLRGRYRMRDSLLAGAAGGGESARHDKRDDGEACDGRDPCAERGLADGGRIRYQPPDTGSRCRSACAQGRRGSRGSKGEERFSYLQPLGHRGGGVIGAQFGKQSDLLACPAQRRDAGEGRGQGLCHGHELVVKTALVRLLMGHHRGDLHIVERADGRAGDDDRLPPAGEAVGRWLIVRDHHGAEAGIRLSGQLEPLTMPTVSQ